MSDPSALASRTSQYLAFASTQFELLRDTQTPFQQRALKHALLNSCVLALLSYLEELDIELKQFVLFQNFESRWYAIANCDSQDYRMQEISNLARTGNSWLSKLLEVERSSQTIRKREQPADEEALIIRVQQHAPPWWEVDSDTLEMFINKLKELIARQREASAEE